MTGGEGAWLASQGSHPLLEPKPALAAAPPSRIAQVGPALPCPNPPAGAHQCKARELEGLHRHQRQRRHKVGQQAACVQRVVGRHGWGEGGAVCARARACHDA